MTLNGYIIYNRLCVLVNECIPNTVIYNHHRVDRTAMAGGMSFQPTPPVHDTGNIINIKREMF